MKKKLGIWAIAITLFISICGCGRGKGGENVQQTALAKDYVYSVETLELEEWNDGTYSNALKSGERMSAYCYEWKEEDVTGRIASRTAVGILGQECEISFATAGMSGM